MKYSYEEYVDLCQNLPAPKKNGNIFAGWYTSLEGGTQIPTMSQLETVSLQDIITKTSMGINIPSISHRSVKLMRGFVQRKLGRCIRNTFLK